MEVPRTSNTLASSNLRRRPSPPKDRLTVSCSSSRGIGIVLALSIGLSGCNTMPLASAGAGAASTVASGSGTGGCRPLVEAQQATVGGAIAGGIIGAALGSQLSNKPSVGARNGMLLGALAGGLAGSQFGSSIKTTQMPDGSVKLDIPGSVLFPSGSYAVSEGFKPTLNQVGQVIREYCGLTAEVVGHTDNVGAAAENQKLSENRASSVVSYLRSTGIDGSRLRAVGYGHLRPVAENTTESGRQQNRRVEILVRPPA
ncbi:OmpA family protein [Ideonella sp. DXS22W]|uniref:OmpA family protein n=1 Tax=Pseudaquabacterium inlustre TaxID=2984192 RepID=A0ABU9CG92_9BURK